MTFNDDSRSIISMLYFPTSDSYDSTISSLEQQIDSLEESFVNQYSALNDSLLDLKEEEINYNDQQPLIDFEIQLSIPNSMRQVFMIEEDK